MKAKRILAMFVLALLLTGLSAATPPEDDHSSRFLSVLESREIDYKGDAVGDNSIDFSNVSDNAIIERNLLTGEVAIIEPESEQSLFQYLDLSGAEPIIPNRG